jgi:hypothetical protein
LKQLYLYINHATTSSARLRASRLEGRVFGPYVFQT